MATRTPPWRRPSPRSSSSASEIGSGRYNQRDCTRPQIVPVDRAGGGERAGGWCGAAAGPGRFALTAEGRHMGDPRRIREFVAREIRPEFVQLIEGGHFVPTYAEIVSMAPQEVLDKAAAE